MADKPTYFELLKHPNWQRKRLEILERARFECENCGSAEKTLHVHHSYYERGLKPWEYPSESLHSLCEDCHKTAQDWLTLIHRQIGRLSADRLEALYGYGVALELEDDWEIPIPVLSHGMAVGLAAAWGTNADFIIQHIKDGVIDQGTIQSAMLDWTIKRNSQIRGESD